MSRTVLFERVKEWPPQKREQFLQLALRARSALFSSTRPRLLAILALVLPAVASADSMIRIKVAQDLATVEVRGERLRARPLVEGGTYQPVEGGRIELHASPAGVALGDVPARADVVRLRADGPIAVGKTEVRGALEVRRTTSGLLVVNEIPMETYLAAVLGSEMPPSFPPEALKAQAVAARTYAIGKKIGATGDPYHLGSSVLSQVYGGVNREDPRTRAAVEATVGEVLVFHHAPIEAYFFSSCGGTTESGAEALGRPLPYLTSHPCPEAADTPGAHWTLHLSAAELGRRLGMGEVDEVRVLSRTASGRARRVEVEAGDRTRRLDAVTFREKLGYGELRSLAFEVEEAGDGFRFTGKGSGHGAGMCQWGAAAAAAKGWDYRRILAFYYPGTELRRMY